MGYPVKAALRSPRTYTIHIPATSAPEKPGPFSDGAGIATVTGTKVLEFQCARSKKLWYAGTWFEIDAAGSLKVAFNTFAMPKAP